MRKNTKNTKKTQYTSNFKLAPMNPCVAGIDIGASSVFICIGFSDGHQEVREYLTFTEDLRNMLAWLKKCDIKSVAMESTGVYWIPVYDILAQDGLDVLLVNPYQLKTVPGRKTDVKDCQWIQQLHAYGLLAGSFRPDDECVVLRGYVRQRTRLFELASQQVQLMHKALTQMNLQINHVLSDITGSTGMNIVRAIVAGERDSLVLAKFRDYRCKKEEKEIAKALVGNYRAEHLLALKQAVEAYDFFHKHVMECEEAIEQILSRWETEKLKECESTLTDEITLKEKTEEKIIKGGRGLQKKTKHNLSPYHFEAKDTLERILGVDLTDIPGLDVNAIMRVIGEIGTDMSRWPTAKHFASWLGLCPGNKISGGKVLSSKTKPSANRAAQAFRLAANVLYRSQTALGAFFRRMRARLGAPKAITAGAHKLAVILYTMIKEKKSFTEAGQAAYEEAYKLRQLTIIEKRAKEMGYQLVSYAG
jgi:transposase